MARIFTSLSWTVGIIALLLAVTYPFLADMLIVKPARHGLENLVEQVAKAQISHYANKRKFVYFTPENTSKIQATNQLTGLNLNDSRYDLEAYGTENTPLIIRGITSSKELRGGFTPPLMYQYVINEGETEGRGTWVHLSNREPGLFSGLF